MRTKAIGGGEERKGGRETGVRVGREGRIGANLAGGRLVSGSAPPSVSHTSTQHIQARASRSSDSISSGGETV